MEYCTTVWLISIKWNIIFDLYIHLFIFNMKEENWYITWMKLYIYYQWAYK